MRLRHAMILAINTSILAVLFVFTAWLYRDSRRAVQAQVTAELDRDEAVTARLAELREKELSSLACSLAASPQLRAAVATEDPETIADVLRSVAGKNQADLSALLEGGAVRYAGESGWKGRAYGELVRGRFAGRCDEGLGSLTLVLVQQPSSALLEDWSQITSVRYVLRTPSGAAVDDLPPQDAALAQRPAALEGPYTAVSAQESYYGRRAALLDGRFSIELYKPQAPFWKDFQARRNSLIVLGSLLFFSGMLLSVVFAALIEKHASSARPGPADGDWQTLLAEIETVRSRLAAGREGKG